MSRAIRKLAGAPIECHSPVLHQLARTEKKTKKNTESNGFKLGLTTPKLGKKLKRNNSLGQIGEGEERTSERASRSKVVECCLPGGGFLYDKKLPKDVLTRNAVSISRVPRQPRRLV